MKSGLWLFLLAAPLALAAGGFVRAQGKTLVAPDGSKLVLRGINLGNWLVPEGYMFQLEGGPASPREIETLVNEIVGPAEGAAFWQAYRDAYITEADIQLIRDAGFNSVRIPFHYKLMTEPAGFALVDRVVGWCRRAGLWVVLDMHCAPGGQTGTNIDDSWGYPWLFESEALQKETIALWRKIAEHYRDEPTVIGYDLLNEPIPHFGGHPRLNQRLEPLYKRITAAIREVDRNHIVIFGGAQWDSNFYVFGPPFDSNAMYTFHKYWTEPVRAVIEPYLEFRDRYNVPIWMGESGENTDDWIARFASVLEENEVGWAFWPYKKMGQTSCPVQFEKPVYWDEVVAYGKAPGGTGQAEQRIRLLPQLDHARNALSSLLENVRFERCTVNTGYLTALKLRVPAARR